MASGALAPSIPPPEHGSWTPSENATNMREALFEGVLGHALSAALHSGAVDVTRVDYGTMDFNEVRDKVQSLGQMTLAIPDPIVTMVQRFLATPGDSQRLPTIPSDSLRFLAIPSDRRDGAVARGPQPR